MEMTRGEITRAYRQSRDKGAQVNILAELNMVSRIRIIEILSENGEEVRISLPSRGKKRTKEFSESEYRKALIKRMDELEVRIVQLETEYKEIIASMKSWR